MIKTFTNSLLSISMFCLFCTGCSSQLRYTRTQGDAGQISEPQHQTSSKFLPLARLKPIVDSYIGVPYHAGGMTRRGVDCSGLVYLVFNEAGVNLPHSSKKLSTMGRAILRRYAQPGDCVFFKSGAFHGIGHIGIYMGNNMFVHASPERGVMYSSLNEDYFQHNFAGIRRIYSWQ